MATTVQPFVGTYELHRDHSTVQFAVRHVQVSMVRASFGDVEARLTAKDGTIALEGQARVESVSIAEPPEFREHVVHSADFLDPDTHPVISFHSSRVSSSETNGTATASGELTVRGATHTITAQGTYQPPREDPFGNHRAGLELQATVDRRSWDMNWQTPLPDGSDALGWKAEVTALLELIETD
jgi:polyisoprenoid-binding protein YceI